MAIGNAPIQESGKTLQPVWAQWLSSIRRALGGWSQTLTGTVNMTGGNVPSLGETGTTFTLTGARVGDVCIVTPSAYLNGFNYQAYCGTDDVITIRACNTSGTLTTLPDSDYTVIVFRQ